MYCPGSRKPIATVFGPFDSIAICMIGRYWFPSTDPSTVAPQTFVAGPLSVSVQSTCVVPPATLTGESIPPVCPVLISVTIVAISVRHGKRGRAARSHIRQDRRNVLVLGEAM